jgi:hypothetical protein
MTIRYTKDIEKGTKEFLSACMKRQFPMDRVSLLACYRALDHFIHEGFPVDGSATCMQLLFELHMVGGIPEQDALKIARDGMEKAVTYLAVTTMTADIFPEDGQVIINSGNARVFGNARVSGDTKVC